MAQNDDRKRHDRRNDDADLPGPAEEHEDGMLGSVDERSSENRRDGVEEDRERAMEKDRRQHDD